MKVGLIADIHGNLVALDAVIADLAGQQVDQIVCLGDVAAGPQASETLTRVRELGWPVVMGNWDAAFVDGMPEAASPIDEMLVEISSWWAETISPSEHEFIRGFEPRLELPLGGGSTLLCFHGSPRSFDDWIFATTGDADVGRMLAGFNATVMAGGHTHLQMIRRYEESVLVNPGSVGLAFHQWWPRPVRIARWAEYGILTCEDGQLGIELRRTSFDVEAFLQLSLNTGMPHADWWVSCWSPDGPPGMKRG